MKTVWMMGVVLSLVACGGSSEVAETDTTPATEPEAEPEAGDDLIPEQAFDDVKRMFERKQPHVSRCFAKAVEEGSLDKSAKGVAMVTVTVAPSGKAKSVSIELKGFSSDTVKSCIEERVRSWTFTDHLNRENDFSHAYNLQQF